MKMKYLVFQYSDTSLHKAFLFPEDIKHADFASMMPSDLRAIRGGFVCLGDGKVKVWGEAFSLGLQSEKEVDVALITKQLEA